MEKILILIVLVLAGVGFFHLKDNNKDLSNIYDVSMARINNNLSKGSSLIDVRTPEEYTTSHAVGAINLPLESIQNGETPDIAKDKIIYVYCKTGKRASQAKTILEKAGFSKVINVNSLDNWVSLGGEVIKSASE